MLSPVTTLLAFVRNWSPRGAAHASVFGQFSGQKQEHPETERPKAVSAAADVRLDQGWGIKALGQRVHTWLKSQTPCDLGGSLVRRASNWPQSPYPRARSSPGICSTLLENSPSIQCPCILAADTPFCDKFCLLKSPDAGRAQVRVTFALGVLVYRLFNYARSPKHLHDALK